MEPELEIKIEDARFERDCYLVKAIAEPPGFMKKAYWEDAQVTHKEVIELLKERHAAR